LYVVLKESNHLSLAPGFHQSLGLVAAVMLNSREYCQYPIACLKFWIEPAILLNQIHFFFDLGGQPIGYMTWAYLAEDTEKRLLHDPDVLLHLSEWNEGESLWILDLVVLDGSLKNQLREAFSLLSKFAEAKSLRRRADGTVRKVTKWRRRQERGNPDK
jgi:cytolysin-activating lysine-acyltransferase